MWFVEYKLFNPSGFILHHYCNNFFSKPNACENAKVIYEVYGVKPKIYFRPITWRGASVHF